MLRILRGLRALQAASDGLNRAVIWACVICIVIMLTISFVGFFYMVITGAALSWTYSLARLFIPWIGLLSVTVAFKSGEHVAMAMFVRHLPRALAKPLAYLSVALIAVFALLMVWQGYEFFLNSTQYYMVSDQFQVHHRWVAACVPVSGAILLAHVASGPALLESARGVEDEIAAALSESEP